MTKTVKTFEELVGGNCPMRAAPGKIVALRDEAVNKIGQIEITNAARPLTAMVLDVGEGAPFSVGDRVLFHQYAENQFMVDGNLIAVLDKNDILSTVRVGVEVLSA